MELILLKSSACLLALLVFYKIALQPLSIHKLKRVYLLAAVLVSAIIPFITFIKYVEPILSVDFLGTFHSDTLFNPTQDLIIEEEPINYLPTILWSIYGLGVALFFTRFCVNLFGIVSKIKKHTKVKSNRFVNVLMEQLEIPHTFFNFIFLNKNKFENNQIPQEVLLHEQTHAKQKHSIDILLLELVQIVFWFNPLLFWLKKEVKLNHEFLADQDVINHGIDTKNYQNILLQFSSNQPDYALANAINYSSIKKRFKLMKTQTPKPTVWLRSLLLLPLLGILIFSFSSTKEVEKEVFPKMEAPVISNIEDYKNSIKTFGQVSYDYYQDKSETNLNLLFEAHKNMTRLYTNLEYIDKVKAQSPVKLQPELITKSVEWELKQANALKINYTARTIDVNVFKDGTYTIDGIKANKSTFEVVINQLHQDITPEIRNNIINIHVDSPKDISDKEVWFIFNAVQDYGFHRIVAYNQEVIRSKGNTPFALEEEQERATKKEVDEYNTWAKKINSKTINITNNAKSLPIVNEKNLIKYIGIYKKMTKKQKESAEEMPFDGIELKKTLKESVKKVSDKYPLEDQDGATKKQIAEYNTLAKKYNTMSKDKMIIKSKDFERLKYLYNAMSVKQRKKAEPFPNFPEPPKAPKAPKSVKVKKGELSNIPPPPPPPPAVPMDNASKQSKKYEASRAKMEAKRAEMNSKRNEMEARRTEMEVRREKMLAERKEKMEERKVELKERKEKREEAMKARKSRLSERIPPPPPPKDPIDHIVDMAKKGASFSYNGKSITSDEAIELIKKNKKLNISSNTNNGVSTVHISEKGIKTVNGKVVND